MGYVFAPSINAVKKSLDKAEFAAVSSSSVDPACFLGHWLEGTYLWDYELPSYSGRSGDSNGYYLLSRIKPLDLETMKIVLQRLPECTDLSDEVLSSIVQEVARRGIPTVRGLSAGNSGATGDLGLFIATRLLQDSFRVAGDQAGLLRPWGEHEGEHQITLVIPVDPFQRYLDDLAKGRLSALGGTDPESALQEVARAWEARTDALGRQRQLWHYRRSLNTLATLPDPPPPGK